MTVTTPRETFAAITKLNRQYTDRVNQIILNQSAGDHTFSGVLAELVEELEDIVGPFTDIDGVNITIKTYGERFLPDAYTDAISSPAMNNRIVPLHYSIIPGILTSFMYSLELSQWDNR